MSGFLNCLFGNVFQVAYVSHKLPFFSTSLINQKAHPLALDNLVQLPHKIKSSAGHLPPLDNGLLLFVQVRPTIPRIGTHMTPKHSIDGGHTVNLRKMKISLVFPRESKAFFSVRAHNSRGLHSTQPATTSVQVHFISAHK